MWRATEAGTPCACKPVVSVLGSVACKPAIRSEKKIPMDMDMPEFWNVARIPDADPRRWLGTLLMMAAVFGSREHAAADPVQQGQESEHPIREVEGDQEEADETQRKEAHTPRWRNPWHRTDRIGAHSPDLIPGNRPSAQEEDPGPQRLCL